MTHHNIEAALNTCVASKKIGKPGAKNRPEIKLVNVQKLKDIFGEQNVCTCTHPAGKLFTQYRIAVGSIQVATVLIRCGKLEAMTVFDRVKASHLPTKGEVIRKSY